MQTHTHNSQAPVQNIYLISQHFMKVKENKLDLDTGGVPRGELSLKAYLHTNLLTPDINACASNRSFSRASHRYI